MDDTVMHEGEPSTKKARVDRDESSLRTLPLPVALLASATHEYNLAKSMHAHLARRPSTEHAGYASTYAAYTRSIDTACRLCRTAIATGTGSVGAGRLELRARLMLVQLLTAHVATPEAETEADALIAKGISLSTQHPSFARFLHQFYDAQARLYARKQPKFSKSILKRALADAARVPALRDHLYGHYLLLADVHEDTHDTLSALAVLSEAGSIAQKDEEVEMLAALRLSRACLLVKTGTSADWQAARDLLRQVNDPAILPRVLRTTFYFVLAFVQTQLADVKAAKDTLKSAHEMLDSTAHPEPLEEEGIALVRTKTGTVRLRTMPKTTVYNFAFLLSVSSKVVHRDSFGTKPKAVLFAKEGVRALHAKLAGLDQLSNVSPSQVQGEARYLAKLKIAMHLMHAELCIMRSTGSIDDLASALATAHSFGLVTDQAMADRIVLDYALQHYPSDLSTCLFVSLSTSAKKNKSEVARLSALMCLLDTYASSPTNDISKTLDVPSILALFQPASSPVGDSSPSAGAGPGPAVTTAAAAASSTTAEDEIARETIAALTTYEITRSKASLASALSSANRTGHHSHAKALQLALLANLFLWTRNDQALKMLVTAYNLARGLGPKEFRPPPDEPAAAAAADAAELAGIEPKERMVGNARLGLWLGERLHEIYEKTDPEKARKQALSNECHRRVLGL